tara:strand:- start:332 stop:1006 length:675 start_codon:yes stop_codon:yes gene_type:complete
MGSNSSSGNGGGGGGNQQAKARRLMTTTPNYSKPKTKSVTAGTLADPREKDDTAAKMSLFREQGATNIKNTPMIGTGAILKPAFQAGSRLTRDYFVGEVLGKGAYKGTSRQEFERMSRTAQESMYKTYITGRTSGKTDAYGREITSTGGGAITSSGQVVQAPKVEAAPTTAELSQASTTEAAEDSLILRKRKTKARGRSPTIMSGVAGVTGGLTLGKPSLLGRA